MNAPVPSIQPLSFGPPHRRLFGIFHPPAAETAVRAGVVLCNAFGQEAVRAHRLMRVLAERLARAGHAVLRFDYHGTGDSPGDDIDGDLEGWAGDLLEADLELRSRGGPAPTVWIGMRLGGAIALQAARSAPEGLQRLVLWDPVLDGPRYLQLLRERHAVSLEDSYSLTPAPSPTRLLRDPERFRDEAIGFALSPRLREQLGRLHWRDHRWPDRPASITVLTDPDDADGRDLAAVCEGTANAARVQRIAVPHGTDWTSDTARNTALVPGPALMQLVHHAGTSA